MKKHCDLNDRECIQNKIAGLGEKSFRKSYYPELQKIERFKALLDQSNDAIFLLSIPEGRFIDINRSACKQLGYDCGDVLKMSVYDIISDPGDVIEGILSGNVSSIVFTAWFCVQAGRKIPYEINARKVYFGGKAYAILVARNIEKRLHIERELRESEEKFRVLAESSSAAIIVYQGEYIVSVNKAAEVITGYTKDELFKMRLWEILDPAFRDMVRERSFARQHGKQVPSRYEIKFLTKDGETKWAELNAGRILYMGEPAGVTTIYDITERKQAEEKMRLTQFAVDNFTDSSIWINPEGHIIYINRITCQTLDHTRDELLSMSIWDIDQYYSRERFLELWNEVKRKGAVKFESAHIRKDGSMYPVEVSANYLKFEDKEYLVTFDRDITEHKRAEEALSDAKEQAELYVDLMGHDINNLNQTALGYLELADSVLRSGGDPGDNLWLIEKPIESLHNSSMLIDKVMKLRKLKEMEFSLDWVDLCKVLNRICDQYSHFNERDVTINYIPQEECFVMGNELIDEIFTNLIENSIKHSYEDRPLVIDVLQTTVCEGGKEYSRISIEDNGPGISDEVKDKLFARFSRGETKAKGKGLGLYLIKTLVEDFNGKVWVEDRIPGDHTKGTRFIVTLPIAKI